MVTDCPMKWVGLVGVVGMLRLVLGGFMTTVIYQEAMRLAILALELTIGLYRFPWVSAMDSNSV
jgi:hypothetical protein